MSNFKITIFGSGALAQSLCNQFKDYKPDLFLIHHHAFNNDYQNITMETIPYWLNDVNNIFRIDSHIESSLRKSNIIIVPGSINHLNRYLQSTLNSEKHPILYLTSLPHRLSDIAHLLPSNVLPAYPAFATEYWKDRIETIGNLMFEVPKEYESTSQFKNVINQLNLLSIPLTIEQMEYRFRTRFLLTSITYWLYSRSRDLNINHIEGNTINEFNTRWPSFYRIISCDKDLAMKKSCLLSLVESTLLDINSTDVSAWIMNILYKYKRYKLNYFIKQLSGFQ